MPDAADPTYQRRREEVVRNAAKVFAERGVGETRLRDIAAGLGMNRTSLYHYVRRKDDLLVEVIRACLRADLAVVEAAEANDGDSVERLRTLIGAMVQRYKSNYAPTSVYLAERGHQSAAAGELGETILDVTHECSGRVIGMLRAGIEDGRLRADLPPELVRFGLDGMVSWIYRWYRPWSDVSLDQVAAVFTTLFLEGCAATTDTAADTTAADDKPVGTSR